jgi:hypothetical protein
MPAGVMTPAFSGERPLWDQLANLASGRSGWLQSAGRRRNPDHRGESDYAVMDNLNVH